MAKEQTTLAKPASEVEQTWKKYALVFYSEERKKWQVLDIFKTKDEAKAVNEERRKSRFGLVTATHIAKIKWTVIEKV